MTNLTVGSSSDYESILAAMQDAGPGDTILLQTGYSGEKAVVTHNDMTVFGSGESVGIRLKLAVGIPTFTLTGTAPINIRDASDGNGIVGNAGNNRITVSGGVDAVDGGLGSDRLIVNYAAATGAVTGDSTSNFTEAGGGGRSVTIADGTIEHFTILTGSGADTITTGAGDDIIKTGNGAGTINAGQGANIVIGGRNADTITALDGGNFINAGNGKNTITSGGGNDTILTGKNSDTVTAGGGNDVITLRGGSDGVNAGAGTDKLIIDYAHITSNVSGGITGGNLKAGYVGHIADGGVNIIDFQASERFTITTGSGNDHITTGNGRDVLVGGRGNDHFWARGGNDQIFGGAGSDWLRGGTGDDILKGGAGADHFGFGNRSGHDIIRGFMVGVDTIDLNAIDADSLTLGNQSFNFIGDQSLSQAGDLRYHGGVVSGDTDGDGLADFSIRISNHAALTQFDFLL
ncbi:MAG: calcium-binding protein [bacterium]